jgi:hypothetical protein
MNYTDNQLKAALAKMLPEWIMNDDRGFLVWLDTKENDEEELVFDTELLHLCWLVEETLIGKTYNCYALVLLEQVEGQKLKFKSYLSATWQQRVIALAKMKGIKI